MPSGSGGAETPEAPHTRCRPCRARGTHPGLCRKTLRVSPPKRRLWLGRSLRASLPSQTVRRRDRHRPHPQARLAQKSASGTSHRAGPEDQSRLWNLSLLLIFLSWEAAPRPRGCVWTASATGCEGSFRRVYAVWTSRRGCRPPHVSLDQQRSRQGPESKWSLRATGPVATTPHCPRLVETATPTSDSVTTPAMFLARDTSPRFEQVSLCPPGRRNTRSQVP